MAARSSLLLSAVHAVHICEVSSRKCRKGVRLVETQDLGFGLALVCVSFLFVFVWLHAGEARSSVGMTVRFRV